MMNIDEERETLLHIYEQQYVQCQRETKEQQELRNEMLVFLTKKGYSQQQLCEMMNKARKEIGAPLLTRHTVSMVLRRTRKEQTA